MTTFATPTINGYRRFRPYSFAPDRVAWGVENRGALVRVQGGPGDSGTHLENRLGEPAANPYLYLAADIALLVAVEDQHVGGERLRLRAGECGAERSGRRARRAGVERGCRPWRPG